MAKARGYALIEPRGQGLIGQRQGQGPGTAVVGARDWLDKGSGYGLIGQGQRHWPGTDWTKAGAGLIGQSQGPGTDWTMAGAGTDWTTPGAMD